MLSTIQCIKRNYDCFYPPKVDKRFEALKVGVFGAANIAPAAILRPAQSHPDVIIAAVAARDESKARAFAKKWQIPTVYSSYQDLLDDKSIDAVYIALPNGLHYEWAQKALEAGKHVLLEKPSTSNAKEAEELFHSDLLVKQSDGATKKGMVLMEASHAFFHPAFRDYLSLLDQPNIVEAFASLELPQGIVPPNDIRLDFGLAGGSLMDCGTYAIRALRETFGREPIICFEAETRPPVEGDDRIDEAMSASWKFPNGGSGSVQVDMILTSGYLIPWLTAKRPSFKCPVCWAKHREVTFSDDSLAKDEEHVVVKTVTFWNYIMPSVWHCIDISEQHTIRNRPDGSIVKQWEEKEFLKNYGDEPSWMTYRYQLEEFVNLIRGKSDGDVQHYSEDSIKQMRVIDSAYQKAGLPLRPSQADAGN